ncbi:hypothetical protein PAXRUDRAFT_28371 [Paxillus rubicundulus Ve08.2h10]|uniref:Uncharacterized protein n=1 Tax=Paxillus rubicundulus Ve08.2h10 TaxID=930991 RepID=A0A0D0DME0_9AGAM|nr:hypothetical protein PAXRUDRAFT_28371 [Paxillus rubicundulus Ve08.2h10]
MQATEANTPDAEPSTEITDSPNDTLLFVSAATGYRQRILDALFLISLGLPTIERLNAIVAPENKDQWKDFKYDLSSRVQNITLVAALILGTTAVFLTTQPTTTIANWIQPMPYMTLIVTLILAASGVGSGMFLSLIFTDVQPRTLEQLSKGRVGFVLALTLLALPTFCTYSAGIMAIISLTGAVWCGDHVAVKGGATFMAAMINLVGLLFLWSLVWLASTSRREERLQERSLSKVLLVGRLAGT